MKTSIFLAFFLLFTLTTQSIFTAAATTTDYLYDIKGKKVREENSYYIGPVVWAKGGGLKLANKSCPSNVVQDPKEVTQGGAFEFTLNASPKETILRLERPLGINSGLPKGPCDRSTFWKIEDPEAKSSTSFVTIGGIFEEDVSCFQVVKFPKPTSPKVYSYMLQHCPGYCGAPAPVKCYNVGIYAQNGTNYLASRGTPFEFVFKQAPK